MKKKDLKILIAGEGGQGVQTVAEVLAQAAFREGFWVSYIPNFGVEQRGGVSLAFVVIDKEKMPVFPKFDTADIIVVLCQRAVPRIKRYIGKNTIFIYEKSMVDSKRGIGLDLIKIAKEKLNLRVFNMIVLGILLNFIKISQKNIEKTLIDVLGVKFKKNKDLKELNLKAINLGKSLLEDKNEKLAV
jgi:2-oxoglutarate ferredoxin oxidoreductase subunit gamma